MELPRRSIEDWLYEGMTALLFYPGALWRVVTDADAGRDEEAGEPFAGLVSPPLFLMISILVAHLLDRALGVEVGGAVEGSEAAWLVFRLAVFSLFPLVMAVGALKREGRPIDQATLRRPFYRQCAYAAPFAISVSVGAVLVRAPASPVRLAGGALILAAVAWYLCVQTRWLGARLGVGRLRAFGAALRLFTVALGFCLMSALLVFGPEDKG